MSIAISGVERAQPFALNKDALTIGPGSAAMPPKLGVLGAFEASMDAQRLANSQFAIETSFQAMEEEQNDKMRRANLSPVYGAPQPEEASFLERMAGSIDPQTPLTSGREFYLDVARYYVDGGTPEQASKIGALNARIETQRDRHPELGLQTYDEMWGAVQKRAQEAEQKWAAARTTLGGKIGGFAGGATAGFDPSTSPMNVQTAPLAGGEAAAARIAIQGGVQGATELVQQLTGVQEERRLLGLPYGAEQAAVAIGGAALGGAAVQGVGEAGAAVFSRWFRSTPRDPAPPPPTLTPLKRRAPPGPVQGPPERVVSFPRAAAEQIDLPFEMPKKVYGPSRLSDLRSRQDMEAVSRQLEDWYGPHPIDVQPHSEAPADFYGPPLTLEEHARTIDPEAFRQRDKLQADRLVNAPEPKEYSAAIRFRGETYSGERHADVMADIITKLGDTPEELKKIEAELESLPLSEYGLIQHGKFFNNEMSPEGRAEIAEAKAFADSLKERHERAFNDPTVGIARVGKQAERLQNRSQLASLRAKLTDLWKQRNVVSNTDRAARADQALRDLSPVVDRAYAAARNEFPVVSPRAQHGFEPTTPDLLPLRIQMAPERPSNLPVTIRPEKLPTSTSEVLAKLPANADAADKVAAVRGEAVKVETDALDKFRAKLDKMLEPPAGATIDRQFFDMEKGKELGLDKFGPPDANGFKRRVAEPAVFVDGKIFTGHDHTNAIDNAVAELGSKAAKRIDADPEKYIGFATPSAVTINGRAVDLDNDFMATGQTDPNTGHPETISVRQFLEDVQKDEDLLKSVGSCSTGATG